MDSHYKRARVTFDGWISEYDHVIYLYTAVPDGTNPESHANTQAGAVYLDKSDMELTIDYASVRRNPKVRDPYAPPALEDGYRDPDSPDYAYGKDEDHGAAE